MKVSRRGFIERGSLTTTIAGIGLAGCTEDEGTTLTLGHAVGSEFVPIGTFSERVAQRVSERTDGDVEIDVHPGGELGTSVEHIEGVSSGTIDMTVEPHDLLDSRFGVLAFPFLYEDYQEMMTKTNPYESDVAQELNQESIDEFEFRALTYLPSGNRTVQIAGKKVCTPEDLEDRVMRSPESEYFISMIEGLGAETTSIDFAEVSSALATGSVDGVEFYIGVTHAAGLFEQLDAIARTNHTQYPMVCGINEGSWQDLTNKQQEVLIEVTEEERQTSAETLVDDEERVLDIAEEEGLVVEGMDGCLDREAFREPCQANMLDAFPEWEKRVDRLRD